MLPCRDLFAVSDKLLLHRSATLRRVRHNSAAQLVSLDITSSACEDKLYRMSKFAGAVCYNVLKICAALLSPRGPSLALRAIHLVPRLLRAASMCSRTLSDTANMRIHGRTKCVPTVEKILCRSLIVSALQISPCYPKGKRESQEGRNLRCLPFWFPRRNRRRSLRFASETLSGFHRKIKSRLPKTPLLF